MSILLADGFEDACLGVATLAQNGADVAVYDVDRCVDVLRLRDGMSFEDALEWFEFNAREYYVGEGAPVFVDKQ